MVRVNAILLWFVLMSGAKPATTSPATRTSKGLSWDGRTIKNLLDDGYGVTAAIEVENWCPTNLMDVPEVRILSGVLSVPPRAIQPAYSEVVVAHKTYNSGWGTSGTVSWLVRGFNRRVYVMWSVPNSYASYTNWLAVGVSRAGYTGHPDDNNLYYQMYYGSSNSYIGFERAQYYYSAPTIVYRDGGIEIIGTMGTGYEAHVKITVRTV